MHFEAVPEFIDTLGERAVQFHVKKTTKNCTWDERSLEQTFTMRKQMLCMKKSHKTFGHKSRQEKKKKGHRGWFAETVNQFFSFSRQIDEKTAQMWSCGVLHNRRPLRTGQQVGV